MTGYGRAEGRFERRLLVVEIRSVNHRYCNVQMRLPRQCMPLEERLKKRVQASIARGQIDVTVTLDSTGQGARSLRLDRAAAHQHYKILKELRKELSLSGEISLSLMAGFRELITVADEGTEGGEIFPVLVRVLDRAMARLERMRKVEGAAMAKDLRHRLANVEAALERIESREGFVVEAYRKRLSQRVAELSGGIPLDPIRLSQEVALFADRSDISEERVRLRTHLGQFHKFMRSETSVGRHLEFLLQEINREINTIGSKANDVDISHDVVGVKGELEKVREQVQNIE